MVRLLKSRITRSESDERNLSSAATHASQSQEKTGALPTTNVPPSQVAIQEPFLDVEEHVAPALAGNNAVDNELAWTERRSQDKLSPPKEALSDFDPFVGWALVHAECINYSRSHDVCIHIKCPERRKGSCQIAIGSTALTIPPPPKKKLVFARNEYMPWHTEISARLEEAWVWASSGKDNGLYCP
jgi:hypothetical protein